MPQAGEPAADHASEVLDGAGQRVLHIALDPLIALFLGIEVGGIARQPLDGKGVGMDRQELGRSVRRVCAQVIPGDDQAPADLPVEVAEGPDHLLRMDRPEEMSGIEPRWLAVERGGEGHDARDLAPRTAPAQDRGLASRRPGRAEPGPKRVTCLVHEGNGCPCATSPLFTRGQSCRSQAATRASLRSTARGVGRWALHPSARSRRESAARL